MSVKFKDWLKLEIRLNHLQNNAKTAFGKVKLDWTLKILDRYANEVSTAMGSVSAHGGYLRMSFLTAKGNEYWKNLSPYTLAVKAARAGMPVLSDEPKKGVYDTFVSEFRIWRDSGRTEEAVATYPDGFAGIKSVRRVAFERAKRTEEGVPGEAIPARHLFTIANQMFIEALHHEFQNPNSPLVKELRVEVIEKIFIGQGFWGKGRK